MAGITTVSSSLLLLPPVLRNRIYELVLPSKILAHHFAFTNHSGRTPAVLKVNRQIRHEATSLYYYSYPVELIIYHHGLKQLKRWLRSFSAETRSGIGKGRVNVRIVFDHMREQLLGTRAFQMRRDGWWISAERSADIGRMVDINALGDGRLRSTEVAGVGNDGNSAATARQKGLAVGIKTLRDSIYSWRVCTKGSGKW